MTSQSRAADPPATVLSDETLLARFVGGDRDALGVLASRYERALLGLAMGVVGGRRNLAMDAVQDTWVRVIRFAKGFRTGSSVKTWLYKIAINAAKDARHRAARMRTQATVDVERSGTSAFDDELGGRVRGCVETMSEDRRLLVLLCYHQQLTHGQVAEVLGVPVGTVKSRLYAALVELRQKLGEEVAS